MDEEQNHHHLPVSSASSSGSINEVPEVTTSSSSAASSRVQEEEEDNQHEQEQELLQTTSSRVSIVRYLNDPSNDDSWSCLGMLFTFWFFASMTVILGFYGPLNLRVGPNCSRLIQMNSFFISDIKVQELAGPADGLMLYSFHHPPPLDVETTWSETYNESLPAFTHAEWIFFLNKGSEINISYSVQSQDSVLFLVIAEGKENFIEWTQDPSYPNITLSWNIIQGTGVIQKKLSSSSDYYVAVGNIDPMEVEVHLNLNIKAKLYNTTEAYFKCSLAKGPCVSYVSFLRTDVAVLTSSSLKQDPQGDDWYVKLSYGERWLSYILGSGIMTVLVLVVFKMCVKCQSAVDGTGYQQRNNLGYDNYQQRTNLGHDRTPLLETHQKTEKTAARIDYVSFALMLRETAFSSPADIVRPVLPAEQGLQKKLINSAIPASLLNFIKCTGENVVNQVPEELLTKRSHPGSATAILEQADDTVSQIATGTKTVVDHNLGQTPWHRFPPKQLDEKNDTKYTKAANLIKCSYFTSVGNLMEAQAHAAFRVVIYGGKLYVDFYYACTQTRAMFTVWGLLQLLRRYPGMIPDVDLMFDCMDRSSVSRKRYRPGRRWPPPPLFRYCTTDWEFDIPFPDWSFWGWPETNIQPWDKEFNNIKKGSQTQSWINKTAHAYWKGNPYVASPVRMELLKCNNTKLWGAEVFIQDWIKEKQVGFKTCDLASQCKHRYKIYAEGFAWSVSLKYILSCGSLPLMINPVFQDFFSRGLVPKENYWPVTFSNLCRSIKFAVDWGNANPSKAEEIGKGAQDLMGTLNMERVYDYMYHLINEYSKLQNFKPVPPSTAQEVCMESVLCYANEREKGFLKGSVASPSLSMPCTLQSPDRELVENVIQKNRKIIDDVQEMERIQMEQNDRRNIAPAPSMQPN
ncbi:hypothetical protein C5167_047216 [Papaver somniferum]|uniref:Glycosyl transferase CAP10 domain-containing protein n=1 Tax=Papaver somniferum TaxID=3469 RepID=A0A4Y7LJL7_PAPSO|nr:hypothetical protein C5167_047216 [Papaver somniferum]